MTEQSESFSRSFRHLLGFLSARRRWQGVGLILLMLVGAVAELLTIGAVLPFLALIADPEAASRFPLLFGLLSELGVAGRRDSLLAITAIFCLIAVGATVVRIILTWATKKYVLRIGHDLSVMIYRKLLFQDYRYHTLNNSSTSISGLFKVQNVVQQTLMPLIVILTASVITAAILSVLIVISAPVALGAAFTFGSVYLAVSLITRRRLERNGRVLATFAPLQLKAMQEGLAGIRDVLIDQSQPPHVKKFARVDDALRDARAANALIGALPRFVIEGLGMVMIALLALVLSNQPGGLSGALPVIGALALGAQRLLPLLQQIYSGWTQLRSNRATFADVLNLLNLPLPADYDRRRNVAPLPFERSIHLEGVAFRYTASGPPVLRKLDIEIPKGARIGFIGKTGSGKSTLIDLVMGLLTPDEGEIRVDGKPLTAGNIPAWQVQIAHVPQQIFLSDGTILENIALGIPAGEIDEERVREAARKADIDAFIQEQPDGYRSVIGERGVRLSGGQRQRIGIARALYKRSCVLILDEATSALDDATETSIMEAIDQLGRDLTVLMVAHRVTTLRGCDVIYRLASGSIAMKGSYDEVIGAPSPRRARAAR